MNSVNLTYHAPSYCGDNYLPKSTICCVVFIGNESKDRTYIELEYVESEDFDQLSVIVHSLTAIMANKFHLSATTNSRIVSTIQDYLVYMHEILGPESWDIIKLINNCEPLDEIFKLLSGEKYIINIYDYDEDVPGEIWKLRVGRR